MAHGSVIKAPGSLPREMRHWSLSPCFPHSFCLCQYQAQGLLHFHFPPASFLKRSLCSCLLQQVLSAVKHLPGRLSTIGTLIRHQHIPPKKPNAPGNCFVTLQASVLYGTELPREDVGSLARREMSVRQR